MRQNLTGRLSLLLGLTAFSFIVGGSPARAESEKLSLMPTPAPEKPQILTNISNPNSSELSPEVTHSVPVSVNPWNITPEAAPPLAQGMLPVRQANWVSATAASQVSPSNEAVPVESVKSLPPSSTSAADLAPAQSSPQQLAGVFNNNSAPLIAQIRRRTKIPGANFIGVGTSFGGGRDSVDFTVFSKLKLLEFPSDDPVASLSVRPTVGFGNQVEIRVPVTVEPMMGLIGGDSSSERIVPFAGLGAAISTNNNSNSNFHFMLTGGADFLLTNDLTLTAMANLLFLSDVQLEGQVGIGYNF